MAETPFVTVQLGQQAGTFVAPGSTVAATTVYPVTSPPTGDLDRGSFYSASSYGRAWDAAPGTGYHGIRQASLSLAAEMRFEDFLHPLEMHYSGGITPSGAGPYTWAYPFDVDSTVSLKPYTAEVGSETSEDQWEYQGVVISEMTMGFDDLTAPGAAPWNLDATALAMNRTAAALTGSLSVPSALETMMGHLTVLKLGTTGTAFASLSEVSSSLVGASITTNRSIAGRAYGGTGDVVTGWGYSSTGTGTFDARVKISSSTKTDIHDYWNSSGGSLGEKRVRLTIDGAGDNVAHWDARIGLTAVPIGERDGERVYALSARLVYDATLGAPCQWTVITSTADLTP